MGDTQVPEKVVSAHPAAPDSMAGTSDATTSPEEDVEAPTAHAANKGRRKRQWHRFVIKKKAPSLVEESTSTHETAGSPGYFIGPASWRTCNRGGSVVPSNEKCHKASNAMGKAWEGQGCWRGYYPTCFTSGGGVWHNYCSPGGVSGWHPVCYFPERHTKEVHNKEHRVKEKKRKEHHHKAAVKAAEKSKKHHERVAKHNERVAKHNKEKGSKEKKKKAKAKAKAARKAKDHREKVKKKMKEKKGKEKLKKRGHEKSVKEKAKKEKILKAKKRAHAAAMKKKENAKKKKARKAEHKTKVARKKAER